MKLVKVPRNLGIAGLVVRTAGYRLGGLPVALLTSVVTSRFLLPTGRGAFVLATLTVTLVASVLRIGGAVTHMVPTLDSSQTRATLIRALATSCGAGFVGAILLIPIDQLTVPHAPATVAFAPLALPAMLITDAMSGLLLAHGRVSTANRVQFLSPVVALGSIVILVIGAGLGLSGAIVGWMIGQCVAAAAALGVCLEVFRGAASDPDAWRIWDRRARQMLWFGIRFGMVGAVSVVNYRIDLLLLRAFHGVHDVGIYSLAVSLAELAWVLPQSIATAVTPALLSAADDRQAASLVARASRFALLLSIVTAVILATGSLLLLPDVFGRTFAASTTPLLVLLPGIVAFSPAATLAVFISLRKGKVALTGVLALLSAIVTTLAGLAVIPSLSSVGAATASTLGYTATLVTALAVFARLTGVPIQEFIPRWDDCKYMRSAVALRLGNTG